MSEITTEITLEAKQDWLNICLEASSFLYGIVPWRILRRLYRKRYKLTEEEIREVFASIPEDERFFRDHGEYLVHSSLEEAGLFDLINGMQEGKPYFIPNEKEIIMIARDGFISNTPENRRMLNTLKESCSIDDDLAMDILATIQRKLSLNAIPSDIMKALKSEYDNKMIFNSTDDAEKFFHVLMDVNNNCRMIIHRGNTPIWLSENPGIGVF